MPMKNPPHPGDFIWTEIIEPASQSQSQVAVENLVLSIPAIKFEFHFGHAIKADAFQEPPSRRFHDVLTGGLHQCASIAELNWILSTALSHKRSIRAPLFSVPRNRKTGPLPPLGMRSWTRISLGGMYLLI